MFIKKIHGLLEEHKDTWREILSISKQGETPSFGVHVPSFKDQTNGLPIEKAPIPDTLILPLHQHIGTPAKAVVEVGDHVLKGQVIARAKDYVSASVHAPTSGKITFIGRRTVPHPSGMEDDCIIIEPDFEDKWAPLRIHAEEYLEMAPSALRNLIRQAGIVGLGGAGFPTYIKMNPAPREYVDTLILNGAECEPFITCDDRLMQEYSSKVVEGMQVIRHAAQAKRCIIAIEDNKPKAIAAMRAALNEAGETGVEVAPVPTVYPAGGEKQLVYALTGEEIPANGLPIHVGVLCQNVGSAAAVADTIIRGMPLISRIVTVAGDVERPRNLEVLIGTPVESLIKHCGGDINACRRLIMGGPMMGFALHSVDVPVIKTTNCIIADAGKTPALKPRATVMPCIRCGACMDVCPVNLLPQHLYWHTRAEEFDRVQEFNLFDCIECGCCDYVCPSHLPLVQAYRYAKGEIWSREREKQKADIARERHEFRQQRIEAEKAAREALRKQKQAALAASKEKEAKEKAGEAETAQPKDNKQAAILAAVERAKAKKQQTQYAPKNTENLTPEQQRAVEEADQRREQPSTPPDTTQDKKEPTE